MIGWNAPLSVEDSGVFNGELSGKYNKRDFPIGKSPLFIIYEFKLERGVVVYFTIH